MLRILHLEDQEDDARLIERALSDNGIDASFTLTRDGSEFLRELERGGFDLILTDNGLPGFGVSAVLTAARTKAPGIPVVAVSGAAVKEKALAALQEGATNYVLKDQTWQLIATVQWEQERRRLSQMNQGMARLVAAVQELSLTRSLDAVMAVVRRAARELTGADGSTFVLREGEICYYADEDAISPLWKGQRFPLHSCISGWAMLNHQPAVIEDVYADPRIPKHAYEPTFVRSMAMVPIRKEDPIGAIGNYWAVKRTPKAEEVELLQALANITAVAIENVKVYEELEKRVKERTAALEASNRELESFSFAVSHDLRAPLRSICGFSEILLESHAHELDAIGKDHLQRIHASGARMSQLIDDLLRLSRVARTPLRVEWVHLSELAREILSEFKAESPERSVEVVVDETEGVRGDPGLLRAALENLLSNAWKYTSKRDHARIVFGSAAQPDGTQAYFVRDNGVGFNVGESQGLFQPFHRFHSPREFAGTGIGLATVQRIIQRHGGRIWAEAEPNKGAVFYFTLGKSS
jgi:signal transduction histidine kinase/DNA-binding response OmpR family regulator